MEPPAENIRDDEVRERLLPVDGDDGDALAVAALELGVAADLDLFQLERDLGAHALEHAARALAEVAAGGGVEGDLADYG
jgi:hypothetical protein